MSHMWIQHVGGSLTSLTCHSHISVRSTPGSSVWAGNSARGAHLHFKTSGPLSCTVIQISRETPSQNPLRADAAHEFSIKTLLVDCDQIFSSSQKAKSIRSDYASIALTALFCHWDTEVRWALFLNSDWIYWFVHREKMTSKAYAAFWSCAWDTQGFFLFFFPFAVKKPQVSPSSKHLLSICQYTYQDETELFPYCTI